MVSVISLISIYNHWSAGVQTPSVYDISEGLSSITRTDDGALLDFSTFKTKVTALSMEQSNDCNEPSLVAINETINILQNIACPYQSMQHNLIVIADNSPSNDGLVDSIIEKAANLQLTIHFLFYESECTTDYSAYEKINEATYGAELGKLVSEESLDIILNHIKFTTYEEVDGVVFSTGSTCQSLEVTESQSLTLYIKTTETTLFITYPNGTTETISVPDNYIVKQYNNPSAGEWMICVTTGEVKFAFRTTAGM